MREISALVAIVLLGLGLGVVPAAAQQAAPGTPVTVGATTGDAGPLPWTVNCTSNAQTGELACTMSQVLIAQDTQQRLIGASIFRGPSGAAQMRLSLPHGILLQRGASVAVDERAGQTVPIVIADQNGSYADLELGADLLQSLQGGNVLHVGVSAGNGETIDFTLSLRGFTAAFAKL